MDSLTACVSIPHFPLAYELAAYPILQGRPVIIGGSPEERKNVIDCSPEAEAEGVRIGMPLRQVLAVCHEAVFLAARDAIYRERFTEMIRALEGVSPIVEPETLGRCYVDLSGVLDLYGGLEGTAAALVKAAESATGLSPRLGFAGGKFPARVAASVASPSTPRLVAVEETEAFLAPLPIDLLPITEETRARLLRLGIGTLGELAALPVTAVQAQFGPEGRRAWALAGGRERDRPRFQPPSEAIAQAITLPSPATGIETLRIALNHLLAQAFARPERNGRGVRQVRLLMRLEGDRRWERLVTFKEPSLDHNLTAQALRPVLESASLAGPVEEVAVELVGFANESGRQEGLFPSKGKRLRQLEASLKHLKAQYRRPMLSRAVEVEPWSRIPERRMALMDVENLG